MNATSKYPLYTVTKCRKDDTFYGPVHFSSDADTTACGKRIDHNWYVITNDFSGKATCKKCLKISYQEQFKKDLNILMEEKEL